MHKLVVGLILVRNEDSLGLKNFTLFILTFRVTAVAWFDPGKTGGILTLDAHTRRNVEMSTRW